MEVQVAIFLILVFYFLSTNSQIHRLDISVKVAELEEQVIQGNAEIETLGLK